MPRAWAALPIVGPGLTGAFVVELIYPSSTPIRPIEVLIFVSSDSGLCRHQLFFDAREGAAAEVSCLVRKNPEWQEYKVELGQLRVTLPSQIGWLKLENPTVEPLEFHSQPALGPNSQADALLIGTIALPTEALKPLPLFSWSPKKRWLISLNNRTHGIGGATLLERGGSTVISWLGVGSVTGLVNREKFPSATFLVIRDPDYQPPRFGDQASEIAMRLQDFANCDSMHLAEGSYQFKNLASGTYVLELYSKVSLDPPLIRAEVKIQAGQTTTLDF